MRALVLAMILVAFSVHAAKAWWQYAKWGMTEGQILAANQGRVTPCTPDVPACAATVGAHQPKFFVDGIHMLAMPVSVSFGFDESGRLDQTVVVFPDSEFTVVAKMLTGINGNPISERPGAKPVATWRDDRRDSTITLTGNGRSSTAVYRPAT